MPRQRLARLTEPQAARDALCAPLRPVAPRRVPPAAALGLVLAEDLRTPAFVPAGHLALADGWAVVAAETQGAGPYAPLSCAATPVAAGELLPRGCDAVLPPEAHDGMAATEEAIPGQNARGPGEDLTAGSLIAAAGTPLAPRHLPALAAADATEVAVRVPRLAWIEAGAEPALFDLLAPLITAEGADLSPRDELAEAADAELILVAGGTGEGKNNASALTLAEVGRCAGHGLAMAPGMSAGWGEVAGVPVVLLPGRVEDGYAAWLALGRPALRALAGTADPPPRTATLTAKVASRVGVAEWVALRGGAPLATGALPLSALAALDGLWLVPAASEGQEAGAVIALTEP
jgi:molybdopterin molybdotransferase